MEMILLTPEQLQELISNAVMKALRSSEVKEIIKEAAIIAKDKTLPEHPTRQQAAEYLQVSLGTIDNWRRQNLLCDNGQIGKGVRLYREDILAKERILVSKNM